MSGFTKFDRHANLVDRMGDAVGVDLSEAVQRGELPPGELRQSVYACIGCSKPDACENWLDAHTDGADETPGYCRNKDLFSMLGASSGR